MRNSVLFMAVICTLHISSVSNAHHGFAAHFYPDQIIRIEGTVTRFDFINPHGFLFIDSQDEDGNPVEYKCDLQARSQLLRRGVDETLFRVGEPIVVEGFKGRRDPLHCDFGVAHFPDGSTFVMRSLDRAHTQFAQNTETEEAKAGVQSIFGKWMRPGLYFAEVSGTAPITGADSITDQGKLALANFDPIADNPVLLCEAGSPVRTWGSPGLATEIYEQDGNIFIYHESMDLLRTIYMDESDLPSALERSDMGVSLGRYHDGDLVIESSNFKAGVLIHSILNSEELVLRERLSINDDGRLQISWTANDPLYFSELIASSQILQSTTQEIIPYECVPEAY